MKRALGWVGIGITGLLAYILLVEVLIRIFFPQAAVLHRVDPTYGYVGIPNKSGRYINNSGEFDVRLKMNLEGFRDVNHDIEKPAGVYRIIFFGDSFTEAKEVLLEQTYWRYLQALMPALPDGRNVEIINMGVSGYGTAQQLLLLRRRALAWKPDLVIFSMTEFTDIWNNHHVLDAINDGRDPATRNKPYFDPAADTLEILPFQIHDLDRSMAGFFRRNFQTYMYLRKVAMANPALMRMAQKAGVVKSKPVSPAQRFVHPIFIDTFRTDIDTDVRWRQAWDLTRRIFLEIQMTCEEAGVDLLVMSIPCQDQVIPAAREMEYGWYPDVKLLPLDWEKPGKIFGPFFKSHGIENLYLYPELRLWADQNPRSPLYFKLDAHFDVEGHRAVAHILKKKIEGKFRKPL